MFEGKRILGLIPARSGSKGIPDKNLRVLGGKSLIAHACGVLNALPWIDTRIISTDSENYAKEAATFGVEAPFLRPSALSDDQATSVDLLTHALHEMESRTGARYDVIVLLEPTSPLRTAEDVTESVRLLLRERCDSVVSVSRVPTQHHPDKILAIREGRLQFFTEAGRSVTRRQGLSAYYARNGVCYAVDRDAFLSSKAFITERTVPYVIDRELVNIDDPIDLEWAEFLMQKLKQGVTS